jgi:hypothetical protein
LPVIEAIEEFRNSWPLPSLSDSNSDRGGNPAVERTGTANSAVSPLIIATLSAIYEETQVHEEKLRDEVLAWQAGQRELHRWKLVAIGGVAALGLGLTSQQGKPQILVICLAPFNAAYCDALLRDHDFRIALIGFFLLRKTGPFSEYEQFIETHPVGSSRWWRLGRQHLCLLRSVHAP